MPSPQSPEFLLVAACCVWPPTPERTVRIRSAAVQALDWPLLLRIVDRQRVAALVHHGLHDAQIDVPETTARSLAAQASRIGLQNLSLAAESVRLQRLLDEAGITVMFLKGVSLSVLAYGSLALKHGKDIDLLVPEKDALTALDLLECAGYRILMPAPDLSQAQRRVVLKYDKEIILEHRQSGLQVELHWHLVNNPDLLRGIDAAAPTQRVALSADASLRTLERADLFAYLCAHGAGHGWSRLKWLADLAALMCNMRGEDIERLYAFAEQRGAGRCAAQALLLCQELLHFQLSPQFARRLAGDRRVRILKNVALSLISGDADALQIWERPFATTRLSLGNYLLGSGWRYWSTELRHHLLLLPDALRLPIPERFPWLYDLFGIVRVPMWVWRKVRYRGRFGAH